VTEGIEGDGQNLPKKHYVIAEQPHLMYNTFTPQIIRMLQSHVFIMSIHEFVIISIKLNTNNFIAIPALKNYSWSKKTKDAENECCCR